MRTALIIVGSMVGLLFFSNVALANKTSVSIESPASAEKGAEITIKVTVSHKGNSFFHHTQWLKIDVNGKTAARFDFTSGNRPETEVFTKEVKVNALKTIEIVAESACNIHGSAGPAKATVTVNN